MSRLFTGKWIAMRGILAGRHNYRTRILSNVKKCAATGRPPKAAPQVNGA
jgi:hypothetical protein